MDGNYPEVETITYPAQPGEVWRIPDQLLHPRLLRHLATKNRLICLRHGRPPYRAILGVPHHVPSGVWRICEERLDAQGHPNPRKGDDNVAAFALVTFSHLQRLHIPCKLVIMAHATTHDPNKILDSPYCQEIFSEVAPLLIECHAAGGRRLFDLELSAGSNPLTPTLHLGQRLAMALAHRYELGVQSRAGQAEALIFARDGSSIPGRLQLPATKTTSLTEAGRRGMVALHLEAKPRFRTVKDHPDRVSPDGLILGRALAAVLAEDSIIPLQPTIAKRSSRRR